MTAQYNFKRGMYRLNRSLDKIIELEKILAPLNSEKIDKLLLDVKLGVVEIRRDFGTNWLFGGTEK